ncbi:MAG: biotin/lipoyl-binding protein, partial [Planktotalea arctica]
MGKDVNATSADDETVMPDAPAVKPQELTFQSDKGASRSFWIALLLVVLIIGWMGSGFVIPSEDSTPTIARDEPSPVAVAVTTSVAEQVTQFYQAEGQALPDRDTMLRAETTGDVAEVFVRKGQDVQAGAEIARLDPTSSNAETARAQEELSRTQRD